MVTYSLLYVTEISKMVSAIYWPENINSTFESGQGIKVVLTSMTAFSEYIVRKMTITKVRQY